VNIGPASPHYHIGRAGCGVVGLATAAAALATTLEQPAAPLPLHNSGGRGLHADTGATGCAALAAETIAAGAKRQGQKNR